jgi:hypothetical protein
MTVSNGLEPTTAAVDCLRKVDKLATSYRGTTVFSAVALKRAARLLATMYAAGAGEGIGPDAWAMVTDLPAACLDVARYNDGIPQTGEAALVCLDQVYDQLERMGYQVERHGDLERSIPMPDPWPHEWRLAVSMQRQVGWLIYALRNGAGVRPDITVVAPFDDGAAGCAEAIRRVHQEGASIFHLPR